MHGVGECPGPRHGVFSTLALHSLASQPYFSAYAHVRAKVAHFRTRMRIRGKIRLARETRLCSSRLFLT